MATVIVRGLDEEIVRLIDRIAHRRHRSREVFLRELVAGTAYREASESDRRFYEDVLDRATRAIECNTEVLTALEMILETSADRKSTAGGT